MAPLQGHGLTPLLLSLPVSVSHSPSSAQLSSFQTRIFQLYSTCSTRFFMPRRKSRSCPLLHPPLSLDGPVTQIVEKGETTLAKPIPRCLCLAQHPAILILLILFFTPSESTTSMSSTTNILVYALIAYCPCDASTLLTGWPTLALCCWSALSPAPALLPTQPLIQTDHSLSH